MSLFDTLKTTSGFNMINSFLNPDQPYKAAEEEANKGWNQAQNYQKPFWQQGQAQYPRLNQAEDTLLDPSALENQWAQSYEMSPYAKQLLEQNRTSGLDAASSMGLMGSSAALGNIQQGAGNIVNQDRQQYMQDLMQKYLAGIGIGQNIYGVGAQTGANLGAQGMQHGQDVAGLKYGELAAPGKMFGQIVGTGLNYLQPGLGAGFTGQPSVNKTAFSG